MENICKINDSSEESRTWLWWKQRVISTHNPKLFLLLLTFVMWNMIFNLLRLISSFVWYLLFLAHLVRLHFDNWHPKNNTHMFLINTIGVLKMWSDLWSVRFRIISSKGLITNVPSSMSLVLRIFRFFKFYLTYR